MYYNSTENILEIMLELLPHRFKSRLIAKYSVKLPIFTCGVAGKPSGYVIVYSAPINKYTSGLNLSVKKNNNLTAAVATLF